MKQKVKIIISENNIITNDIYLNMISFKISKTEVYLILHKELINNKSLNKKDYELLYRMFSKSISSILEKIELSKIELKDELIDAFSISVTEDIYELAKDYKNADIIYHIFINQNILDMKHYMISYLDMLHKMVLLYGFSLETLLPKYTAFYIGRTEVK
jgi:hypothetical protein